MIMILIGILCGVAGTCIISGWEHDSIEMIAVGISCAVIGLVLILIEGRKK